MLKIYELEPVAPRISRRKKKARPKGCNRVTIGIKQQKVILYFVNVFIAVGWTFCRKCVTIYLGNSTVPNRKERHKWQEI